MKRFVIKNSLPDTHTGCVNFLHDRIIERDDHIESLQAHIAELTSAFHDWCCDESEDISLHKAFSKTHKQSLDSIKAQAINDLISEKTVVASIDGVVWSVIYVDDAEKYADKLRG